MADSVYKVVELVGASSKSWEDAAKNAVETAGKSLKNLRIAEINKLDMTVEGGKVTSYRARVSLSFKYGAECVIISALSVVTAMPVMTMSQ